MNATSAIKCTTRSNPWQVATKVAALATVLVVGGCGWSPRDEFMQARAMRTPSTVGDRSTIAMAQPGDSFFTADAMPASVVIRTAE